MPFERLAAEVHRAIQAELERIGLEIERDIVLRIEEGGHEVDGALKKSVTHSVQAALGRYLLEVGAYAHYAPYVEYGTRPHWAPIEPLRYWVRKKINPPRQDIEHIARAVQRTIARRGTRPHPFAGPVFELWREKVADELKEGLLRRLS